MSAFSKRKNIDFTSGPIPRELAAFAAPILLGHIFQNLYNSVDAIVVGRCVGTTALAAVTVCSDISNLLVGFFMGLSTGAGVVFSRYFGSREEEKLRRSVHTALLFSAMIGLFVALVGIPLSPLLLRAVACPADVMDEAVAYLRIYLFGVLFTSFYNVGSGVLRSVGNSRDPFYYLVLGSVTNILLDFFFVLGLDLGVIGVGLATVVSQGMTVLLVIQNLRRTEGPCRLEWRELRIDWVRLREIVQISLPAALQTSLISFSNLFVQRYVNLFGSSAMAGIGAARKIDRFINMISQSLALSVTTFVSQNVGAGKLERARRGMVWTMVFACVLVTLVATPIYFYARPAIRLFIQNEEAVNYGVEMLHVLVPLFIFQTAHVVLSHAARGYGYSMNAMVTSLLGVVGVRQAFLIVSMSRNMVIQNNYWAYPVGWISALILLFVGIYISRQWDRRKKKTAV